MSIATKRGDGGQTGLAGGVRISKADLRVEAYGTVDELNTMLGFARSICTNKEIYDWTEGIQRALNPFGPVVNLLVGADATGKAQHRIQLVNGAIRLNAQVCLRDAYAAGQTGLSAVSTFRCDTHISSPCTSSVSPKASMDSSTRIRITLRRAVRL